MHTRERLITTIFTPRLWLPPVVMGLFLIIVAQYNFLAFHTLAELFAIVIAFVLFAFGWATRDIKKDNFLLFLACGYFWVGSLDLIHTFIYEGMNIFTKGGANLSTQFWIGTRYMEALLLLGAPIYSKQVQSGYLLMSFFGAIAVGLVAAISSGFFPVSFIEGEGLTDFKIYSEYLIIFILALALAALFRSGRGIATEQKTLIAASIIMTMCAELAFTFYVSVYGLSNLAGHIFKLFSYWFIFQAIIIYNLKKPFSELHTLQGYTRSLFEDSVTGMALCKEDGTFVDVNPAFARLTGYTVDELKSGMSYWALTPEHHLEQEESVVENFANTGKLDSYEKEYLRKDGSLIPVQISGKSVFHDGETYYLTSVEDITERQKLNKTSAELEFQKQALDEHAIVSIADAKGNITYVNDKFCEISGYSREELLGENHRLIKSDEHSAEFYKDMWRTIVNGKPWSGELKNRTKDGGYYWSLITIVPFLDEQGKPVRYIAIRSDITERKDAERASREFKTTLDFSNDAIHMFWPDTLEYFYVNQTALDMSDLKEEEFIGSTLAQFNPNFDEDAFRKRSAPLVLGKEKSAVYEFDYVNRNGKQFSLEVFLQFITPKNGKPRFVSIARDIKERVDAERTTRQFKTTLDLTENEVFMFWPDTLKFFYLNQAAKNKLGWHNEEFLNMTPLDISLKFGESEYRDMLKPLILRKQKSLTFESVHKTHYGEIQPVEINLQYQKPEGEKPRFIAIVKDITERQKVDKAKSEFISTVSHELRTPLTSIKGVLGLIMAGAFDKSPEKLQSMVKIANDNSERLAKLIDDLLDIDKINAGVIDLQRAATNINWLVEEAIQACAGYAEEHGVTYICSHGNLSLVVDVNKDRLMQVMANLLSNAAKFSPRDGKVEVSVSRHGENIRVAVKDYGCGIPEEARATIFDRFTQADSSDQREKGGTGLGLNIAKAIVEGHGGTIGFTSEIGKGTTFYVDLKEVIAEDKTLDEL